MDLTNAQWEVLEPLIPDPVRRADGRGRPWRDSRSVLNSMTCPNAIRLTKRVTDASSSGTTKVCWMRFFEHWPRT